MLSSSAPSLRSSCVSPATFRSQSSKSELLSRTPDIPRTFLNRLYKPPPTSANTRKPSHSLLFPDYRYSSRLRFCHLSFSWSTHSNLLHSSLGISRPPPLALHTSNPSTSRLFSRKFLKSILRIYTGVTTIFPVLERPTFSNKLLASTMATSTPPSLIPVPSTTVNLPVELEHFRRYIDESQWKIAQSPYRWGKAIDPFADKAIDTYVVQSLAEWVQRKTCGIELWEDLCCEVFRNWSERFWAYCTTEIRVFFRDFITQNGVFVPRSSGSSIAVRLAQLVDSEGDQFDHKWTDEEIANQLAHGGGFSKAFVQELVETDKHRLECLRKHKIDWKQEPIDLWIPRLQEHLRQQDKLRHQQAQEALLNRQIEALQSQQLADESYEKALCDHILQAQRQVETLQSSQRIAGEPSTPSSPASFITNSSAPGSPVFDFPVSSPLPSDSSPNSSVSGSPLYFQTTSTPSPAVRSTHVRLYLPRSPPCSASPSLVQPVLNKISQLIANLRNIRNIRTISRNMSTASNSPPNHAQSQLSSSSRTSFNLLARTPSSPARNAAFSAPNTPTPPPSHSTATPSTCTARGTAPRTPPPIRFLRSLLLAQASVLQKLGQLPSSPRTVSTPTVLDSRSLPEESNIPRFPWFI